MKGEEKAEARRKTKTLRMVGKGGRTGGGVERLGITAHDKFSQNARYSHFKTHIICESFV